MVVCQFSLLSLGSNGDRTSCLLVDHTAHESPFCEEELLRNLPVRTFPGVPIDRIALRTWIFLITPAAFDRILDSTADAGGGV